MLQSLTAQYTDSEGEEDVNERTDRKRRSNSQTSEGLHSSAGGDTVEMTTAGASTASPSESNKSGTNTPQSGSSISGNSIRSFPLDKCSKEYKSFLAAEIRRVAARLVSYNNDEAMSDEENGDESEEDSNSRVEFPLLAPRASRPVSPDSDVGKTLLPGEELLPPEPTGKCSLELQEKITRMYEKMLQNRIDMNMGIQQRKHFRNPSIYEKLIDHLDIEEIGTNYPPVTNFSFT